MKTSDPMMLSSLGNFSKKPCILILSNVKLTLREEEIVGIGFFFFFFLPNRSSRKNFRHVSNGISFRRRVVGNEIERIKLGSRRMVLVVYFYVQIRNAINHDILSFLSSVVKKVVICSRSICLRILWCK